LGEDGITRLSIIAAIELHALSIDES
jgi:hypothetical protein